MAPREGIRFRPLLAVWRRQVEEYCRRGRLAPLSDASNQDPAYTRNLTTSYKGQLLEINFTTNLNTDPKLKEEIDRIVASIHLEE